MKNLLTDKTLKAFEEWYEKYIYTDKYGHIKHFWELTDSMQYGVIVDFFNEKDRATMLQMIGLFLQIISSGGSVEKARKAAVEKANELFNQIN